jgi:hypothetical protein
LPTTFFKRYLTPKTLLHPRIIIISVTSLSYRRLFATAGLTASRAAHPPQQTQHRIATGNV